MSPTVTPAAKKLMVSVRLNEYKLREHNPHVPYTPQEIAEAAAACREAGACIVHFHARHPDGSPCFDPEVYAECAARIRERCDILVDVTLGQVNVSGDDQRLAHVRHMARDARTRVDFAAVDTGSTNVDAYDAQARRFRSTGRAYVNSVASCITLIRDMQAAGVRPAVSAWTVPFLRTCDALIDSDVLQEPVSVQIVLCEGGIVGGHPGTAKGLQSMVDHLPLHRRIEWTVCCKEGNLFPAAAAAIQMGGHVAPGIGDYAYPELGYPDNAALVRQMVALGRAIGREPATPAEARVMLGLD